MGDRYYITGVQLGMLLALQQKEDIDKILKEIEENQFVGRINQEDKDRKEVVIGDIHSEIKKEIGKDYGKWKN